MVWRQFILRVNVTHYIPYLRDSVRREKLNQVAPTRFDALK